MLGCLLVWQGSCRHTLGDSHRVSFIGFSGRPGLLMENTTGRPSGQNVSKGLSDSVVILQVLVGLFFYVNSLMIFTFFKKETFRRDTRYVLFAHMLCVDSVFLATTDMAMLLITFQVVVPCRTCIVLNLLMIWLEFCTPFTLVAMCLERYVAICRPLHYALISTPRTRLVGLVLIWTLGSVPVFVVLISFSSVVSPSYLSGSALCSVDVLILYEWQRHLEVAVFQFFFFLMSVVIALTYVRITEVARAASGDNKLSSSRGTQTVALHAMQLLLCLLQLTCPFIEMFLSKVDFHLYANIKFLDFVVFSIAPRCLSPLVYGVRDQKFFAVLKHYALFGLKIKVTPLRLQHLPVVQISKRL